ncbi:MAG: hypothetical protein ACWGN7_02635 [Thermodesulfovibrionales bacterium]
MKRRSVKRYHDELFRRALSNVLKSGCYHASSPVEKHRMLVSEFERLYWEQRENLVALPDTSAPVQTDEESSQTHHR